MHYSHLKLPTGHGDWTLTVPIEPDSLWWCFGWPFGHHGDLEPELAVVEVYALDDGRLYYRCQGQLFHPTDHSVECVFKRVELVLPILPAIVYSADLE